MAGINVAGLRRNIKNLAHNYSDAQVKVREATSNDPWGPSSTLMAEIADLTYNVVAFSEIMQMIWKRTNDHGKNWRHVYKALLLLEYLIKTGSEKVAQQCKENIFAIQTLKDFQYLEEGKDQGVHVREKAKNLIILLKDDEKLKNERARALKAKERFARTASGFGSDGSIDGPSTRGDRDTPVWPESDRPAAAGSTDIEFVRPQTVGEEELQLQLAMAMSREEAEQEEQKRRSDDVRLQLALSQSEQDFKNEHDTSKTSNLVDLLDISFGATSISSPPQSQPSKDPWGLPPPTSHRQPTNDIWSGKTASPVVDPWLPSAGGSSGFGQRPDSAQKELNTILGNNDWSSRTKSPSGTSSSSIEGWLQNVQPPASGAVPVLPAKINNDSHDAWLPKAAAATHIDPWNGSSKPPQQVPAPDPWDPSSAKKGGDLSLDPWAPVTAPPRQTSSALAELTPSSDLDEFDIITNRSKSAVNSTSPTNDLNNLNNNNASLLDPLDPLSPANTAVKKPPSKTPQAFLGENSNLVNLDNLIKPNNTTTNNNAYNPFGDIPSATNATPPRNLFQQPIPSINQLKQQPFPVTLNQDPWAPINNNEQQNEDIEQQLVDPEFVDFNNNELLNAIDSNLTIHDTDDVFYNDQDKDIQETKNFDDELIFNTSHIDFNAFSNVDNQTFNSKPVQEADEVVLDFNQTRPIALKTDELFYNNINNNNPAWMNQPNLNNPFLS